MSRHQSRGTVSGLAAVVTGLIAVTIVGGLALSPTVAQINPCRLTGTVVDEAGEPVSDLTIRFVPVPGASYPPTKIKVKKKGRFSHSFFPSGQYLLELDTEEMSIRHVSYRLEDKGILIDEWEGAVHPEMGMPPVNLLSGHQIKLNLVVQTKEQEKKFKQAIKLAEASDELKRLGELYDAGEFDGMLAEADRLLEDDPELGQAVLAKGVALWQLRRFDESEPVLRRAIELVPDDPAALGILGTVLLERGNRLHDLGRAEEATPLYAEAADQFDAQLARTPEDIVSINNRVVALERANDPERLEAALRALIAANPGELTPYFRLADMHLKAGDMDAAVEALSAIPAEKDAAPAIFNIAAELFNEGKNDVAILAAKQAQRADPELHQTYGLLGRAYLGNGDMEQAIASLERFVELCPAGQGETERAMLEALKQQ